MTSSSNTSNKVSYGGIPEPGCMFKTTWNDQETKDLIEYAKTLDRFELAEKLNKSVSAITNKCKRLKVRPQRKKYNKVNSWYYGYEDEIEKKALVMNFNEMADYFNTTWGKIQRYIEINNIRTKHTKNEDISSLVEIHKKCVIYQKW